MKVVNLLSPKGEKVQIKVSFPFFLNRGKVRDMLREGYTLESERDAELVSKLGLF